MPGPGTFLLLEESEFPFIEGKLKDGARALCKLLTIYYPVVFNEVFGSYAPGPGKFLYVLIDTNHY